MVLEAFAAVGLAGNIVQFLDFSCKLFSTATSIHGSHTGSSEGYQDVEIATIELQRWCVRIPGLLKAPDQQQTLQSHQSLLKLATNCEIASRDLLSALQPLRAKKPKSKWSSFKAALATTWKETQINDMERRLNSYRQQLALELAILQSDDNKDIRKLLDSLEQTSRSIGTDITLQILELRTEIRNALETLKRDLEETQSNTKIVAPHNYDEQGATESIPVARTVHAANLADCSSKGSDIMACLAILEGLTFEQMRYRHDTVIEAHPETFEWAFASKFRSWLKSPDPIFWISGKPGSGKSTMMKKLVHHPKTPIKLRKWSGSSKLVIVDYFFWVNGTEIQRSQEGLLRALLFDLLRQTPNLIKDVLPQAWNLAMNQSTSSLPMYSSLTTPTWTRRLLLEAFQCLSSLPNMKTKFCIFIDGLDEYDGDHEELIQTIRHLTKTGIKLCVASRPWNVFEEAFGSNDTRKIYMQHLNTADIQHYVHEKLKSHPNFKRIDQHSAAEIADEIVEKSQGVSKSSGTKCLNYTNFYQVFLWVRLVVRSLTEGLRNRDSITLLRQRLHEFPSDLNQFFRHMFLSLETVYRSRLSHMFQVALASECSLSTIAYWFLDEVEEKPDLALTMSMQAVSDDELSQISDDMVYRINGRSRGLLEVSVSKTKDYRTGRLGTVDFLHRTVKDFFMTTDVQQLVIEWQHPRFDLPLTMCKITLAEFKMVALISKRHQHKGIDVYLCSMHLNSATDYEINTKLSPSVYLVEFEQVFNEYASTVTGMRTNLWRLVFDRESFLAVIAKYDLCIFMTERINKKPLSFTEAFDCLRSVLSKQSLWNRSVSRTIDLDGIPEIFNIILSDSPTIMDDSTLENDIVERSLKLDSNTILNLAKRLVKHGMVSSSLLEDAGFKKALSTEITDKEVGKNLKEAYEKHWCREAANSTSKVRELQIDQVMPHSTPTGSELHADQESKVESKSKQKSNRTGIRKLLRKLR